MRIIIETIPHKLQRYPTVGDWYYVPDGTLHIVVSEMADERSMFLVALHELIEAELCNRNGVSEQAVTDFDMAHPELDDPGNDPRAPYHEEHIFAEGIERIVAMAIGRQWDHHEDHLSETTKART
jgi:hypothetical protein